MDIAEKKKRRIKSRIEKEEIGKERAKIGKERGKEKRKREEKNKRK